MAKIQYISKRFNASSLEIIERADAICREYEAMGYVITLRQLYYQFVARGLIANKDTEYKRIGGIISDARLAGEIDWRHLEDRTRNLVNLAHWNSPSDIIDAAAKSYRIDRWVEQPYYVEVWVEKEALASVVARTCQANDVPYIACRGYMSQSEMWARAQTVLAKCTRGRTKKALIIHLGDHDPSGIDMTRDIRDRMELFLTEHKFYNWSVERVALNMDQIQRYAPPPNPAKITDSRSDGYIREYGDESWELDALPPDVLDGIIQAGIDRVRDQSLDALSVNRQARERDEVELISKHYGRVVDFVNELEDQ